MRIGVIGDLAVGMDPNGSHAWSRQADVLAGLSIGAPPDLFNPRGQDWGLTGFSPRALTAGGFAPFLATVRAALRNAGGVRIDHVMGLTRLWLIPQGADPADGAYLAYPLGDLLRLLALESQRHGAIVVGEDLGTVPGGFREELEIAGLHGMRVLWFERNGQEFSPPDAMGPRRHRDDLDARSADRGGLVAWQGYRDARRMRAPRRRRERGGRGGGARNRPRCLVAGVRAGWSRRWRSAAAGRHATGGGCGAGIRGRHLVADLPAADRGPDRASKSSQTCRERSTSIRTGGGD